MESDRSSLTTIVLPDTITKLGNSAFARTTITHIILPVGLLEIGDAAFSGCNNLMELDIPRTVTFIGSNAFHGCSGLRELSIPSNTDWIGSRAFESSVGLRRINLYTPSVNTDCKVNNPINSWFKDCSSLVIHILSNLEHPEEQFGLA